MKERKKTRVGFCLFIILVIIAVSAQAEKAMHSFQPDPWNGVLAPVTPESLGQVRAVWASRYNYKTAEDVKAIINNLAQYNFNTLILQVRGNGTVLYRSDIEPWSMIVGGEDPGWDPLGLAVAECHRLGLEVHTWINAFPSWRGQEPPPWPNQLWNAHPDWFMVPRSRKGMAPELSPDYSWISPGVPEVQDYIIKVVREVIEKYKVDGVHFDFIRYPGPEFSYDKTSIQRFKSEFGKDPEELPAEYAQWQRDQITNMLSRCYEMIKQTRPEVKVSAAVFGNYEMALSDVFQEWHSWLARGILDYACPMIYRINPETFEKYARQACYNAHQRFVLPGLGTYLMRNHPEPMRKEVEMVHTLGARGLVFFDYASLFPEHAPNDMAKALITGIGAPFARPARIPQLPWQDSRDDDSIGAIISKVSPEPLLPFEKGKITISARITDSSGVYDTKGGSASQGIYLLWSDNPDLQQAKEIELDPVAGQPDIYKTVEPLLVKKGMKKIYFRLYAYDNDADKGNPGDRALGTSELYEIDILKPLKGYKLVGEWGEPVLGMQFAVVDPAGKLWVCSWKEDKLVVFDANGKETAFSPITSGLDPEGKKVEMTSPAGIAMDSKGTIYVVNGSAESEIFKYDYRNGNPQNGLKMKFKCADIDIDKTGYIYTLELIRRKWHKLTPTGEETTAEPFAPFPTDNILFQSPNLNRGIAVTDDGSKVYIASEGSNTVDVYVRTIKDGKETYEFQPEPLTRINDKSGAVDIGREGRIYVSDGKGYVQVFSLKGKKLTDLKIMTRPEYGMPRGVAFAPDGKTLYIIPTGNFTHTARIQKWFKQ